MWSIASLARQGRWLCLLGSLLALVGFFLPYYNLPPGEGIPSRSLWDIFVLLISQPSNAGFLVALGIGTLLLLLFAGAVLAFLVLFLRSPRWKLTTIALNLTRLTLISYMIAALITLYVVFIGEEIANTSPKQVTPIDILSQASIGDWLIPVGLILALIGSSSKGQETRAGN